MKTFLLGSRGVRRLRVVEQGKRVSVALLLGGKREVSSLPPSDWQYGVPRP
jgi:hypothetical protein